jgi:tetratricopeptide (TPR) repeat protein
VHWHPPRPLLHDQIRPTHAFSGRWGELLALDNQLWHRKAKAAAIVETSGLPAEQRRSAAVTGLGGIGKSTLARQYGWEAQGDYAGVWWLHAEKAGSGGWTGVMDGLAALGANYHPQLARNEPEVAATETRRMLERGYFDKPWLLIFDNVDDPKVLDEWAPKQGAHVLATSRLGTLGRGVAAVDIKAWALPDAVGYLLALWEREDLGEADARRIAEALGGLPLALSHASAYLRTTTTATADSYLAALTRHMHEPPEDAAYDKAVFATFAAQMEQAERLFTGSADVLRLAASYGPDEVPEELFQQTAEHYPPALRAIVADRLKLERALGALDRLSLIDFAAASRTFSVHRVVQAAARDGLRDARAEWARHALGVLFAAFPDATQDNWRERGRLAAHVPALAANLDEDAKGRELGWLFVEVGDYQRERGSLAAAAEAFEASLAIRERLAKADPGNAGWRADLAASHGKIGQLYVRMGRRDDALGMFRAGRAIVAPFAEASGHRLWIGYLRAFDADIAALSN